MKKLDRNFALWLIDDFLLTATRLLSGQESRKLSFETYRYCTLVFEDAPINTPVIKVFANHIEGNSLLLVKYGKYSP